MVENSENIRQPIRAHSQKQVPQNNIEIQEEKIEFL